MAPTLQASTGSPAFMPVVKVSERPSWSHDSSLHSRNVNTPKLLYLRCVFLFTKSHFEKGVSLSVGLHMSGVFKPTYISQYFKWTYSSEYTWPVYESQRTNVFIYVNTKYKYAAVLQMNDNKNHTMSRSCHFTILMVTNTDHPHTPQLSMKH